MVSMFACRLPAGSAFPASSAGLPSSGFLRGFLRGWLVAALLVGGSSPAWSAPPNAPASDREEARKEGSVRVEYDVPFTERVDALRSCDLYLPPVADEPSTEKV